MHLNIAHCNFNNDSTTEREKKRSSWPVENVFALEIFIKKKKKKISQMCCYLKQFYLHGQLPFCKHFWMIFFPSSFDAQHTMRRWWWRRHLRWWQLIYRAYRELCVVVVVVFFIQRSMYYNAIKLDFFSKLFFIVIVAVVFIQMF